MERAGGKGEGVRRAGGKEEGVGVNRRRGQKDWVERAGRVRRQAGVRASTRVFKRSGERGRGERAGWVVGKGRESGRRINLTNN